MNLAARSTVCCVALFLNAGCGYIHFGRPKQPPVPNEESPYAYRVARFKEPSGDAQLGTLLESQFSAFLADCQVEKLLNLGDRTSIPDGFWREPLLHPTRRILTFPESSGRRLFRFVTASANLAEYPDLFANAGVADLLDEKLFPADTSLPVLRPDIDASNVGYTHTCTTYLGVDLSGKVKPPASAISAALSTELNKSVRIVAVRGFFQSPLEYLIEQDGPSRLAAYLAVLRLYERNPDLSGKGKYLSGFRGVLLFRTNDSKDSTKFDFAAQVKGGVPLASGAFKAKAGFDLSTTFSATDYTAAILVEPAGAPAPARPDVATLSKSYIASLPTVAEIQAFVRARTPVQDLESNRKVLAENVRFAHWVEYSGIPADVCSRTWTITRVAGSLDVSSATVDSQEPRRLDGYPSCRFHFSALPSGTPFTDPTAEDASFVYELQSGKDGTQLLLSGTTTFNVTVGPFPVLVSPEAARPDVSFDGAADAPLKWNVDFRFQERGATVDWARQKAMKFTVTSSSPGLTAGATPPISCNVAAQTCTLLLRPAPDQTITPEDLKSPNRDTVQVTGTLLVPLVGSKSTVARPLTLNLSWPRKQPNKLLATSTGST